MAAQEVHTFLIIISSYLIEIYRLIGSNLPSELSLKIIILKVPLERTIFLQG